jgi:hypothetical protein
LIFIYAAVVESAAIHGRLVLLECRELWA